MGDGQQTLASAASNPGIYASSTANSAAVSISELMKPGQTAVEKRVEAWNPFEEEQPFSQMTEDHIFEAEFDKIRQRGSQGSTFWKRAFCRNINFFNAFRHHSKIGIHNFHANTNGADSLCGCGSCYSCSWCSASSADCCRCVSLPVAGLRGSIRIGAIQFATRTAREGELAAQNRR